MEEFDFDLNNEIGTTVSQLRTNNVQSSDNLDNDFDYDKIMENFNSETNVNSSFNYDTNRDSIINTLSSTISNNDKESVERFSNINDIRPKKQQNMNRFVKDLENNLDNFNKISLNEPLPVNFTKQMIPKPHVQFQKKVNFEPMANIMQPPKNVLESTQKSIPIIENKQIEEKSSFSWFNNLLKFEFREIIISMLLFMVLNNKIIIELIYNKLPIMQTWDSPYPNLLLRTIIFGLFLIIIKKFNL